MIRAASKDHTEIATSLIQAGAALEILDVGNRTALMWAALRGNTAIAEALIDAGALIDVQDLDQKTALIHAAHAGHL